MAQGADRKTPSDDDDPCMDEDGLTFDIDAGPIDEDEELVIEVELWDEDESVEAAE